MLDDLKIEYNNVPTECYDYYSISKGDNLYSISKNYNINPQLLANINGLKLEDYIYPGQRLIIPKSGYSYYLTSEGDTLNSVINTLETDKESLIKQNKDIYLLSGQLLVCKK